MADWLEDWRKEIPLVYPPLQDKLSLEGQIGDQKRPDKREVGRAYYHLAKLYYDKAELDKAEETFLKSYHYAERPADSFSILKILGFLIRIASEKLEKEKAQNYITESKILVEELGQTLPSLNAEYFFNVGLVKHYTGEFEEARKNLFLAYKASKEENVPDVLTKSLLALAINAYHGKNFNDALEYLDQLEKLFKAIDKSYLSGAMYYFMGKIYLVKGDYKKALESFDKSHAKFNDKVCWNLYGHLLLNKGTAYKLAGDFSKSLFLYREAKSCTNLKTFRRLANELKGEIDDLNDSSVDLYLDLANRKVKERSRGTIDFKHRFVLLEVLFLLAKNIHRSFDKEKLAKAIWKGEYNPMIHDKLIYTSVSRLRKLIEPKNQKMAKRKYIIRGKDGYTFNPDVKIRFHKEAKEEMGQSIANVELSSPV